MTRGKYDEIILQSRSKNEEYGIYFKLHFILMGYIALDLNVSNYDTIGALASSNNHLSILSSTLA